jgi:hypothetical protein
MIIALFLSIGFMFAVLYIDLVFDMSALPYRNKAAIPKEVLDSISSYYRRVTGNPWVLIFVMATCATCLVREMMYKLVSPRIGYCSIVLFLALMLVTVGKVIPAAKRLASGKESEEKKAQLAFSLFPYHLIFLIMLLALTLLQFSALHAYVSHYIEMGV